MATKYYYLIHFQYLGFRYHGFQKQGSRDQPQLKTIELMIEKTIEYILGNNRFKILGCSRTDSKVSANHTVVELFVREPLSTHDLHHAFNENLPNDIRVLKIEETNSTFNIINTPKIKEYVYLFASGQKCHPFCASLMSSFNEDLNVELMKQGALIFKGIHNFKKYCTKPSPNTKFERHILVSKIEENHLYNANFFPEKSYIYRIQSEGFMRNQVRLMMGQLLSLGRNEIGLDDIEKTFQSKDDKSLRYIAPASGLILNRIDFK